jgi:hypothetical protein
MGFSGQEVRGAGTAHRQTATSDTLIIDFFTDIYFIDS